MTDLEICNMALGFLGRDVIASLTGTEKRSVLCAANIDVARRAVLRERDWRFAEDWWALTSPATDGLNPNFPYEYTLTRLIPDTPTTRVGSGWSVSFTDAGGFDVLPPSGVTELTWAVVWSTESGCWIYTVALDGVSLPSGVVAEGTTDEVITALTETIYLHIQAGDTPADATYTWLVPWALVVQECLDIYGDPVDWQRVGETLCTPENYTELRARVTLSKASVDIPDHVASVIAAHMAALLALPLTENRALMLSMWDLKKELLATAAVSEGRQGRAPVRNMVGGFLSQRR